MFCAIFKKSPQYSVIFNYGNAKYVARDCLKVLPNELLNLSLHTVPLIFKSPDITRYRLHRICLSIIIFKFFDLQLEESVSHPKNFFSIKNLLPGKFL